MDNFNPKYDTIHPEEHNGLLIIRTLIGDISDDLNSIIDKYNYIIEEYKSLISETNSRLEELDERYTDIRERVLKRHNLQNFNTEFSMSIKIDSEEKRELDIPVSSIAFTSKKDNAYSITVNDKTYSLFPVDSIEGKTVISRYGDFPKVSPVISIEEPIKSFSIAPKEDEEITVLLGKGVLSV